MVYIVWYTWILQQLCESHHKFMLELCSVLSGPGELPYLIWVSAMQDLMKIRTLNTFLKIAI